MKRPRFVLESGTMNSMPKKIEPALRAQAVRLALEHRAEDPPTTVAAQAVAKQVGVGNEGLRRWVAQPRSTPASVPA